ncbi:FAD-binding oxidoreductase [Pseudonocardia sp.]|uniref:FAD-binding oxidoreductase n=1 Tax=Pseudonocardia sp. TaxID=60912 RepID=UPI003D0E0956
MTSTLDVTDLRTLMTGPVVRPGDAGYDRAALLWNGDIERSPAAVARCTGTADVAAALAFARDRGLAVAVRGGGHSYSGASIPEDGLVIDLGPMNGVVVDPAARRARVGGGATLAELDAATQAHGLAVTGGTVSHTGVGGLTLGGGLGWLVRRHGLSIDNLVSAEIVLADGRVVRASEAEHPDLFWALRGGGGNFGVVTELEFTVHEVGPLVHVGLVFFGTDRAEQAVRAGRDVLSALPRSAGGAVVGLNAPPAPFVPPEHRLAPVVCVFVAGFGGAEELDASLAPLRAAGPLFEAVLPMPYTALQQMLDAGAPWGIRAYSNNLFLDEVTDAAADVFADGVRRRASRMSQAFLLALGGRYGDVADGDTAFGGPRSARFVAVLEALAPDAETLAADRGWVRETAAALRPFATSGGGYVNVLAEIDEERVRASYGAKYDRLARIKAAYDPGNVFRSNANIKPA